MIGGRGRLLAWLAEVLSVSAAAEDWSQIDQVIKSSRIQDKQWRRQQHMLEELFSIALATVAAKQKLVMLATTEPTAATALVTIAPPRESLATFLVLKTAMDATVAMLVMVTKAMVAMARLGP